MRNIPLPLLAALVTAVIGFILGLGIDIFGSWDSGAPPASFTFAAGGFGAYLIWELLDRIGKNARKSKALWATSTVIIGFMAGATLFIPKYIAKKISGRS